MQMHVTCLIHIKPDLKHGMYSHVEVHRSLGIHKNRNLLALLLIMLKSLCSMKQVENVYG